ncbi:MAG TPA: hypothetical protein VK638_30140 [Edaphobacter sp.]|nr:hypothetical protein [Edaphobacter sp.]
MTDEKDPRHPVKLRKELGFRKTKALTAIGAGSSGSTPADASKKGTLDDGPSLAKAAIDTVPAPRVEQSFHTSTPNLEAALEVPSADGAPSAVRAVDPQDDSQLWSAAIRATPGEPRGPDYTSLDPIMSGLVRQTERYRRQWRNKYDKDPEAASVVANQKTQEVYGTCGRRLLARYIRFEAPGMAFEDVDPRDFVNWMLAWKPFWDENTWRLHRAGAIVAIHTIPSPFVSEALAWLYSAPHIRSQTSPRELLHAKRMEPRHLEKLKFALGDLNSKVARSLEIWLDAGIHTGLQPAEWPLATLETRLDDSAPDGRRVWLYVVMGHVQGNWLTHRTLEISKFSDSAVETVRQMIGNAREWASEEKFAARQGEVARLLRDTSKMCFNRMELQYDLHSLRQQFIENMRSLYGDAEVAALAGHLCVNRDRKHYSKRRTAWEKIDQVPLPSQQWVARMENRLDVYLKIQELMEDKANYRLAMIEKADDPLAE